MNTFKRNALTSAVFASLGIAGTAHAVYQDANGLGQALIYPYYTVNNGATEGNAYNTYISVVNTTTSGKVVKVRFREGKNSREVLDFNLYLSPNDVWTGSIVPDGTSATAGGRLLTFDTSCTNPAIPATGVAFRNFAYSGAANDDGAGTGLDRTREGYVEMLEMATLTGASLTAITHPTTGLVSGPTGCASVQGQVVTLSLAAPTGGLSGTGTLINVLSGADGGYEAIALANVTVGTIYTDIGNESGNLAQADPVSVVVTSGTGTRIYRSLWTTGIDAVSSTMMHSSVINEFVTDTATKSNTDWVMTFPTKRFYVTTAAAVAPFTNKFTATGSCETIGFTYFNREERGATAAGGDFSPLPPGQQAASLCWESTVLSVRPAGLPQVPTGTVSGVLGSSNMTAVNLIDPFQSGWARLTFTNPAAAVTGIVSQATSTSTNVTTGGAAVAGAQTYTGLPVVGFMARTFNNGNITCAGATCQGNYGSAFNHSFLDTVAPAP